MVCKLSNKGLIFDYKLKARIEVITVMILVMFTVSLYFKGLLLIVLFKRFSVSLLGVT